MLALALERATPMARVPASLPAGIRVSDHISLGVIARTFPPGEVRRVLAETGRASERERDLPAHVMVYYAIALALYAGSGTREVLRCLLEGLRWLWGAEAVRVAGKSGISQARTRLGEAPLRRLYERLVRPVATPATKGARYRRWRLVSLDGSCLDVADTGENCAAFGRPEAGRGESAFPQLRFVALVENGTHVLFGARLGRFADGETTLARDALTALQAGMLCLADRQFFGHALWHDAAATGADLLWRVKRNLRLPRETRLTDGSCLTTVYPSEKDRRHRVNGVPVRVVEYRLEGVADAEPLYRLVTTVPDPDVAPSAELAALYHERWEIEVVFTQMTKAHRLAAGAERDDVADLDLAVADQDPVDQQLHQLALPREVRGGQAGLDPSAEVRGRGGPPGELGLPVRLGVEPAGLRVQRLEPLLQRLSAALVLGQRD